MCGGAAATISPEEGPTVESGSGRSCSTSQRSTDKLDREFIETGIDALLRLSQARSSACRAGRPCATRSISRRRLALRFSERCTVARGAGTQSLSSARRVDTAQDFRE